MKKLSLSLLGTAALMLAAPATQAQEYMFTYSKLYTQLKNNNKEGHDDVKVGVFFVNADTKQLCNIEKAWMEKEEHYEEFVIPASKELPLPIDKNLKSANPLVFVQTPIDTRCDYSLVVMTKEPLQGNVSYEQLAPLMPQMQSMLEDLGGMFAGWFTPDVQGVTMEFSNGLDSTISFSNGTEKPIVNGKVQVALSEIGEGGTMTLPEPTMRVLPYLPKAK
ncbi:DUF2987 domain-containing protein [Vibrio natriegens]|uniref:DUF2987 domain-containing protein n=1 Tax=Vibrio natriegens NBRC 15636 = ATCC 14048 = DSM 759 TaxID=1219067 RepID=A0AAN0Y2G5_VIBNA|nr:DUF2987 domain-containing protein [Vibrio natriegens]CAH0530651.1 hypothetical protein CTH30272_02992 [Catenococcus thiocycli]ALR15514.1 hypothetical protein PN96_05775 [Vibrio natriegens NBRC 15636 = ATCC 14048 = DSM 759]ANQ12626.1 hypothetical protein BA890_07570 [Vibrio natriegens NBRC 15636 = ATCC 14048 = DSM 759]ANQ17213.1 hypothetical protein BA891_08225 [Vibrio natriegens]EPM42215.1 hypothetical protein M272_03095 [Vibrio natriegens NBRC 15636 = ATCC 14048 = DSM 759]